MESAALHSAQDASRTETKEQRDDRRAREKEDRREARRDESRKAAGVKAAGYMACVDRSQSALNQARELSRLLTTEMVLVMAEVALNTAEAGPSRITAAQAILARGIGSPREYVTKLDADLSRLNHGQTAAFLLQEEQAGRLSMEESKHLLELSEARESSRLSALEAELEQLRKLVGQVTSDPTTGQFHRVN
jgi:hypothetical protein